MHSVLGLLCSLIHCSVSNGPASGMQVLWSKGQCTKVHSAQRSEGIFHTSHLHGTSWSRVCTECKLFILCSGAVVVVFLFIINMLLVKETWYTSASRKTCLYNIDPLKPHFYIVKLGFTGVYIIFLIFARNIDCWYSLEPPRRGGSNEYPLSMFWAKIWRISKFFIFFFFFYYFFLFIYLFISFIYFFFFCDKIFSIFEKACFRNGQFQYVQFNNVYVFFLHSCKLWISEKGSILNRENAHKRTTSFPFNADPFSEGNKHNLTVRCE